ATMAAAGRDRARPARGHRTALGATPPGVRAQLDRRLVTPREAGGGAAAPPPPGIFSRPRPGPAKGPATRTTHPRPPAAPRAGGRGGGGPSMPSLPGGSEEVRIEIADLAGTRQFHLASGRI